MTKIISFIMSLIFAIDMFFVGLIPEKQLSIINTDSAAEYFVDGEGSGIRFGVMGDGNLFTPGEDITVVVECLDKSLDGTRVRVSVHSEQTSFSKRGYIVLSAEKAFSTFTFSSDKNGIFTIELQLPDLTVLSFNVGVIPRNEQADDGFYYGIQPYITRAYTWGEGFRIPGLSAEESVERILDTAEYLGVNLVREDSVGWGAMQSEPYGDVNFAAQDYLVGAVNAHGMKYNWILGFNAGKWSAGDKYKESYDEAIGWTYPPDEYIWADFAQKTAEHYADNPYILWEIWNEPNWTFFAGTPEEYFSLLESTAGIIKAENPSAYVFSGGLANAHEESNSVFYEESSRLISEGLLDSFAYHNHDGLDSYYDNMSSMYTLINSSGLTCGGINTESGVGGTDAETIACKALYTRSKNADGFVSFSFRATVTPENDVNDFAFFNEYMQPDEAVIAYATVIRFLGKAQLVKNISDKKELVIDEYVRDGKKIEVYYSLGEKTKISAPAGEYEAFDMYGNKIDISGKMTVSSAPVYIIYK